MGEVGTSVEWAGYGHFPMFLASRANRSRQNAMDIKWLYVCVKRQARKKCVRFIMARRQTRWDESCQLRTSYFLLLCLCSCCVVRCCRLISYSNPFTACLAPSPPSQHRSTRATRPTSLRRAFARGTAVPPPVDDQVVGSANKGLCGCLAYCGTLPVLQSPTLHVLPRKLSAVFFRLR